MTEYAIVVNGHTAMPESPLDSDAAAGIEAPDFLSRDSIKRNHTHLRSGRIQQAIHHNRIALHLRIFERIMSVIGPGDLEPTYIFTIDLRQRRITDVIETAINWPFRISGTHESSGQEEQKQEFHGTTNASARIIAA